MKTRMALAAMIVTTFAVALMGIACPGVKVDCDITGLVVDGDTDSPVDSARVYIASVYIPVGSPEHLEPHFVCLTDEAGKFSMFVGCDRIHILDVEKEGYVPARKVVRAGSDVTFTLERLAPSSEGMVCE
jgi:hypothetical protein